MEVSFGSCWAISHPTESRSLTYLAFAGNTKFSEFRWSYDFTMTSKFMQFHLLQSRRHQASGNNIGVFAGGFSIGLDNVLAMLKEAHVQHTPLFEVIACVRTDRRYMSEIIGILRSLRMYGIKCGFVKSNTIKEGLALAQNIGANYYVFHDKNGVLRLRTWKNEKSMKLNEIIVLLKRKLRPEFGTDTSLVLQRCESSRQTISTKVCFWENTKSLAPPPRGPHGRLLYQKAFFRRIASQIQSLYAKKRLFVLAVDLPEPVVRAMFDGIDPNTVNPVTESDIDTAGVINRYPNYEQCIEDIVENITTINALCWEVNCTPILCLYSLKFHYYCFTN